MENLKDAGSAVGTHRPWNKGKLVGAKPPLRPKHVWSIRTRLQLEDRKRDLALFNLAIDGKLRGCDGAKPTFCCRRDKMATDVERVIDRTMC